MGSTPGNEGWSGREGQPPGSSGIKVQLTPAGSWWFEETSAGLAVAGGARARTSLGLEHTGFSAIGEPFHEGSWTE